MRRGVAGAWVCVASMAACSGVGGPPSPTEDTDVTVAPDTDSSGDTDPVSVDPCATPQTAPPGMICTVAGMPGVSELGVDGVPATQSGLYIPLDVTVGPDFELNIVDWNNHRLRRVNRDGTVYTLAGNGFMGDGPPGDAHRCAFSHPSGIAYDARRPNEPVVAGWHTNRIYRLNTDASTVDFIGGVGFRGYGGDGGPLSLARLALPGRIAFADDGTYYFSDLANEVVRAVGEDENVVRVAGAAPDVVEERSDICSDPPCFISHPGSDGDGGPALDAHLDLGGEVLDSNPGGGLAVDGRILYIADSNNHVVRALDLDSGILTHVAGVSAAPGYSGDGGAAATAALSFPTDVAVDSDHSVYIADTHNSCVRRVDPSGVITTVAGVCGVIGFEGDGGPAVDAHLYKPHGLDVDRVHHVLFIADSYNHVVRRVNL